MRPLPTDASAHRDAVVCFNECYEANYRSIRRFLCRLLNDAHDAEDVAQESFARLWQEIEAGVELQDARAWLYRVAANLVTSRLRHQWRAANAARTVEQSVRRWHSPAVDVERAAMYRELVPAVLARLPHPMRLCLVLYHEGLTGAEMAHVLGVKASYVGTLVVRAHERFRREYERLEGRDGLHR